MLGTTKNCQLKCFFATNWCKCKWNLHNVNTFSHFSQGQPLRHRIACIAYFSLGYSFFMVLVYNSKLHHCAEEASHLRVTVQDVNECEKCKKPIKARNGDKWRRHQKKKICGFVRVCMCDMYELTVIFQAHIFKRKTHEKSSIKTGLGIVRQVQRQQKHFVYCCNCYAMHLICVRFICNMYVSMSASMQINI